jgi:hypothetical protein
MSDKTVFYNGKWIKIYRYIWIQAYGEIPKDHMIHHINGNHDDNRIENLQCVTQKEHSILHAKDMSEALKGRTLSEEHKKHLKDAHKKHFLSSTPEERKHKPGLKRRRNPLSEETKQKLREARQGKKMSEETKKKISDKLRKHI